MLPLELPGGLFKIQSKGHCNFMALQARRHILHPDPVAVGQNHHVLDDIIELAHIAFPEERGEKSDHFGPGAFKTLFKLGIMTLNQVLYEEDDVLGPFPKRRDMKLRNIEPVVKIFTKTPFQVSLFKSLFVAATTRTSMRLGLVLPIGRISFASRARSSLT